MSDLRVRRIVGVKGVPINIQGAIRTVAEQFVSKGGLSPSGHNSPATVDDVPRLTRREREIAALLLEGCTNKQVTARLGVSDQTVKNQLTRLYEKLGVRSRLELVVLVQRSGLRF